MPSAHRFVCALTDFHSSMVKSSCSARSWSALHIDRKLTFWGTCKFFISCTALADAQPGATYGNYTSDRIIYAPTDLVSVLGRVLAFNASDQATAFNLGKGYNISAYNPGGTSLQNPSAQNHSDSILCSALCLSTNRGFCPLAILSGYEDFLLVQQGNLLSFYSLFTALHYWPKHRRVGPNSYKGCLL